MFEWRKLLLFIRRVKLRGALLRKFVVSTVLNSASRSGAISKPCVHPIGGDGSADFASMIGNVTVDVPGFWRQFHSPLAH